MRERKREKFIVHHRLLYYRRDTENIKIKILVCLRIKLLINNFNDQNNDFYSLLFLFLNT